MINQTKLLTYSLISFILFLLLLSLSACNNAAQTTTNEPKEELITYEYIVTSIDSEGLKGDSLTDDTGIFLTHDTIEGLELKEGNKIAVSFPKDNEEFDVITKVIKIN